MRRILNKIIFAVTIALGAQTPLMAFDDAVKLNKLNYCKTTKPSRNDYEPKQFGKTNNLLRATGQLPIYQGDQIIVYGQVVDSTCTPVSDCTVYMWQVNPEGKYPYIPLRSNLDKSMLDYDDDLTFIGSGATKTNNNGKFYFITLRPKSLPELGCHVNVRIKHDRLGEMETSLGLRKARVPDPSSDREIRGIYNNLQAGDTPFYKFRITLTEIGLDSY